MSHTIIAVKMFNELRVLKKGYRPFKGRIEFKIFLNKLNSFTNIEKWNFVRGSLLYQRALKCKRCDPNIAMLLLCSCADAIKIAGKNAGSLKNFKQFYIKYCPIKLKDPPIEYYTDTKLPPVRTSFNKALDFIYKKFGNLYIHEGIEQLEPLSKGTIWADSSLLDKFNNNYYVVDILIILDWFSLITIESLFNIL